MTKEILIANRGEVAIRIVHARVEMDIRPVAVCSEADHHTLRVKRVDGVHNIGADPLAGCLNPRTLMNLAMESDCNTLCPGYDFLSEDTKLMKVCVERGVKFIGPSTQMIRRMGDKTEARRNMIVAGAPCTPGTEGSAADLAGTLCEAERTGYPVTLKTTSGGGDRGIRRCNSREELEWALPRAIFEATRAFGSAEVFLKEYIINPKHIKAQILTGFFGNTMHLSERDCSIRRRSQKLIEIAPNPQFAPEQRAYVGDPMTRAAKAVGCESAGTVELLLTDGKVYLMKMNARVQVEHTVAEEIAGVDVIRGQIHIASRLELPVKQDDIAHRDYALQFRISAKDPESNFLSPFDKITRYYTPGDPGARTDTTIYTSYTIPPCYDLMRLKLIVQALTWEETLGCELHTLDDMHIQGVETTALYYQEIPRDPEFRNGQFNTSFIGGYPELVQYSIKHNPSYLATVIAIAITTYAGL